MRLAYSMKVTKKHWAIGLFIGAAGEWFFPGYNGFFFESSSISTGESQIIAAVFLVGGLLLWFGPDKPNQRT